MSRRAVLLDAFSVEFPVTYTLTLAAVFFSGLTVLGEVRAMVGWGELQPLLARVLAATAFGPSMLWLARRRHASAHSAS